MTYSVKGWTISKQPHSSGRGYFWWAKRGDASHRFHSFGEAYGFCIDNGSV
jgi:hypothetical protein